MSTIVDIRTKQDALLKDGAAILTQAEKDIAIQMAVKAYSRYRPLEKAGDIAGTGAHTYNFPAGWVDGFSSLKSIEYPQGQQDPEYVPLEEVAPYRSPSGLQLRFTRITLANGQTARVLFTAQHVVDVAGCTVPASDEDALSALAASNACQSLANYYAQTQEPTIGADVVDYRTKSQEYSGRAKSLEKLFKEMLGISEDDNVAPASGTRDWGSDYQWGEDRMLHPRDRR